MPHLAPPEHDAPRRLPDDETQQFVLQTVATHAEALLRTAERHSLCADDAHDAYQRGLEIFMRRAATLDPEYVGRWLHVVVKREAMEVRRGRSELVAADDLDYELPSSVEAADPEDRVLSTDRSARAAEALRRLKPQELRTIWLKALGHSYDNAAGTEVRVDRPHPIKIDNNAPAPPVAITPSAAISRTNGFSVSWALPPDAGAPITEARYQLCGAGSCGGGPTAASLTPPGDLGLPSEG